MPHTNAILALRREQLARATKPFRARGSRVVRCEACLLPEADCICTVRPAVTCRSAFCFLVYPGEAFKPSNSGRLIADIAPDNHAFLWQRTACDPRLQALLEDERYAPMVVFPHDYAAPERCIHHPEEALAGQPERIPLFVMLEGTWREARKMFRSPWLASLPVLGLKPEAASRYLMRDAAHPHQLCTAEVGIELLKLAGEPDAAQALADYFERFCAHYAVIKPHLHHKTRGQTPG
ncbi:DTW domain-containing protein [Hahella sp. SMD15-11]|uniref:tRNA-uridine aminocarboxypropyltransferase n=1 Tax=Thermohahella caldifontis TaxID=3142973 RepID=A0AB39USW3_9GAMM